MKMNRFCLLIWSVILHGICIFFLGSAEKMADNDDLDLPCGAAPQPKPRSMSPSGEQAVLSPIACSSQKR